MELFEIELFDHLIVCFYKMCLQIIFDMYGKTWLGIK